MKAEMICDAIGLIDDDIILTADNRQKSSYRLTKIRFARWGSIAACLCLAAIGAAAWLRPTSHPSEAPEPSAYDWPIKTIPNTAKNEEGYETAMIPHWDEMTITQQFSEVNYLGSSYTVRHSKLAASRLGDTLENTTLTGYDEYSDKEHDTTATLYAIKDLSSACAVAIQYEGETDFYPCTNAFYRPDTLGEFIEALNLRENLRFGSIWYSCFDDSGEYFRVEFTGADSKKIWELLLSDTSAKNIGDDWDFNPRTVGDSLMEISVDVPLLGYRNICLSVTKNGYLFTNILDTGKFFYIGTDRVDAFMDYVLKNCQGWRIVYEEPLSEGEPE